MTAVLIDHARVSTDQQDLTAQRDGLTLFGVSANRIHVDHLARTRELPLSVDERGAAAAQGVTGGPTHKHAVQCPARRACGPLLADLVSRARCD